MQIFINCLGQTKCLNIEKGVTLESIEHLVKTKFELESDFTIFNNTSPLEISQLSENANLYALVDIVGGKGAKKKRK